MPSRRGPVAAAVAAVLWTAAAGAAPAPAPSVPAARTAVAADHVVVVMLDGTRPDALRVAHAPNLYALAAQGAQYLQARTIYPSQTRVAFVSLPTGAWPSSHGIMGGDDFMDAGWTQRTFGDVKDPVPSQELCRRPTIFEEATAAGLTSLYAAMKGYELVGARGATWTINLRTTPDDEPLYGTIYDQQVEGSEERAVREKLRLSRDLLDRTLAILSDKKPNLVVLNLGSADYMAHSFGPDSPHYREAIEFVDGLVGELMARLDALGVRQRTAIVVSADHGFTELGGDLVASVQKDGHPTLAALSAAGIEHRAIHAGGRALAIYLRRPAGVSAAVRVLRGLPWIESVYCEDVRARCDRSLSSLHSWFPGRSPQIMVDLDDDVSHDRPRMGDHGSLRETDMRIPLILSGAGVKSGAVLGQARLIDVAPTVARLLGLPGRVLRPDGRVLADALTH